MLPVVVLVEFMIHLQELVLRSVIHVVPADVVGDVTVLESFDVYVKVALCQERRTEYPTRCIARP